MLQMLALSVDILALLLVGVRRDVLIITITVCTFLSCYVVLTFKAVAAQVGSCYEPVKIGEFKPAVKNCK